MLMLYRQRWGLFYLPVVLAAVAACFAAAQWLFPLPPRSLVIGVGVPQGGFAQLAERYRDELEQRGIALDIVTSPSGALGPMQHLEAPGDPVQAGFAHGLLANRASPAPVQALAVIGKQPVWIFTREPSAASVAALRGLRVSAGAAGSPTREVTGMLLAQAQLKPQDVVWQETQGLAAANDLLEGRTDVIVTIASGESPTVRLLSRSAGIFMLGIERADALAAREPRLAAFVLPQGAIELRGDVPARDLKMLYAGTHLLVRDGMHPALQRALLDAATEIHSIPSFLQRLNEYPDFHTDFPLSPVADRYSQGQRPWLETVLPYWWAQLAQLLLYAVLPILVVAGLALVWIPRLFSLRVDAVLAHYYGELNFLEQDVERVASEPIRMKQLISRLDQMESEVASLDLPDRFADRWYTLRQHLVGVRERLLNLRAR